MYNYGPYNSAEIPYGYYYHTNMIPQEPTVPVTVPTNKYVYIKQNTMVSNKVESNTVISKVLVNPHFNKKVFVNPNFNVANISPSIPAPKIHINPNVQEVKLNVSVQNCPTAQKIHINPNILRSKSSTFNKLSASQVETKYTKRIESSKETGQTILSTSTKLIRSPLKTVEPDTQLKAKRRLSIRSKFKIVKSSMLEDCPRIINKKKRRPSICSKYKIVKSTCLTGTPRKLRNIFSPTSKYLISKFKLVKRQCAKTAYPPHKNKKYVYVNRFISISDIARTSLLKQIPKIKELGETAQHNNLYLQKKSNPYKTNNMKNQKQLVCKSKYKFIRKLPSKLERSLKKDIKIVKLLKPTKQSSSLKLKKNSLGKLRKCNVPCPFYRKFGKCRANENGKCFRKHDPDQIALCTRFLQGACIDKKCLLSHNVLPEKMPTCKFYLEGSCSKDDCPYLHVRINPKADICRDFLEGFCKKAAECDKRHQFLCPDYEKSGSCLKQRCPYPHGKMVRKYSVFNKHKFAKKSSSNDHTKEVEIRDQNKKDTISTDIADSPLKHDNLNENCEAQIRTRYYVEQNAVQEKCLELAASVENSYNASVNRDLNNDIRSRPKLGKLPSFIAFEEV